MDLGIAGKQAIVCASSRGLGRGCAFALAEAGCDVVVNGRDHAALEATAAEIAERFGVEVKVVAGDVSKPETQAKLIAACPDVDILVNNNGGPPRRDFREIDREAMLAGLIQNMVTPLELIRAVVDKMAARGFGRIVNITSQLGADPDPGPRPLLGRAGRTDRVSCRRVQAGRRQERYDQQPSPRQDGHRAPCLRPSRPAPPRAATTSTW